MSLPPKFLAHLRQHGYHPRSDKHSNELGQAIVSDLLARCATLSAAAERGEVAYDLNADLRFGTSTWNVDLVIGRVAIPTPQTYAPIVRRTPDRVQIAIEIKTVMTEHRKAVKNRKRDFEAHHEHVHNYDQHAIAGAVMLLNQSPWFKSPLRVALTHHGDDRKTRALVEHCLNELRNVTERRSLGQNGMDAKCAIIVSTDNVSIGSANYVERAPAPQPGDPLHYDGFIDHICTLYERYWAARR